jgi:hypothetical protein
MDRCWSCRTEIEENEDAIETSDGEAAVCLECWQSMPVEARIRVHFLLTLGLGALVQQVSNSIGGDWPFGPGPSRN